MTQDELLEAASRMGNTPLFSWTGGVEGLAGRSLEDVSGQSESVDPTDTPMIRRVKAAWKTPLDVLTCEQVRLLLGQEMGFAWLANGVCEFVRLWPFAETTFYPGDMTLTALRRFQALFECDPVAARAMLTFETAWMEAAWGHEDGPLAEGLEALAKARRIAGV